MNTVPPSPLFYVSYFDTCMSSGSPLCKYIFIFSILELAKERMYSLYYDYILDTLGGEDQVDVIAGDTDSVMVACTGLLDKNQHLEKLCETGIMDTSNFPVSDKLFSEANCRIPGTLKEETANVEEIEQIISLNASARNGMSPVAVFWQ